MSQPEMRIADRAVGHGYRPLVIAEVGINHDGDFSRAIQMFRDAAEVGAECVKIQSHVVDDEMIPNDVIPGNADEPIWDMMKRCALNPELERELQHEAEQLGLIFLSTPFSRIAADYLNAMGVPAFKIGSGECNNYPLVDHIASFGRPVIVSTGMNDIPSIAPTVAILRRRRVQFALLHCTSLYPTPYEHVRLGALAQIRAAFPDAVLGLSDHSPSIYPLLGAVPLGAAILERHFTSDSNWDGPDISVSMTPMQLRLLIEGADAIHLSLGGTKEVLPEEQPTIDFAYASVVTIAPVAKGEQLTRANLWVKRPGTGEIRPADYERILGRRAAKDLPAGVQVCWAGPCVKRILIVTGTRADFGKQKGLMKALEAADDFELQVVVTGMHLIARYGETVLEVLDQGFTDVQRLPNQVPGEPMDLVLANTISGFGRLVHEHPPDAIIVHGDRLEALAGAVVGAIRNIRVIHLEGGELSGTIDGSIRHAISKLAHVHLVANDIAAERLRAMGESPESVLRVGSLEVDALLADRADDYDRIVSHYDLPSGPLGVAIFHPVTTDPLQSRVAAEALVDALLAVDLPFVVIDPNNDEGTLEVQRAFERLAANPRIRRLPSMRFEAFITLLKHCAVIVGNSSSGVREAPVFGTRSVNIGSRQRGRAEGPTIRNVPPDVDRIVTAITEAVRNGRGHSTKAFGQGGSVSAVLAALRSTEVWDLPLDKRFFEQR